MICLRSGYCCLNSAVVIVVDPERGIEPDNLLALDGTKRCPHLRGDTPGKHSCAIHDEPWYTETPCAQHGQIERQNSPCRMGENILKGLKNG